MMLKSIKNAMYSPNSCPNRQFMVDEFNLYLQQLVGMALLYPAKSLERQRYLTQIIRLIVKSDKMWCDRNAPHYDDALQKTWQHLCENLDKYDSTKASLTTWLNQYLKWRIIDGYQAQNRETARQEEYKRHLSDTSSDDSLEAEKSLEKLKAWLTADAEGILSRTYIREHPEVNCQTLILRKLQPDATWKTLAAEFGINDKTLSSFYQRKCMPILREFGKKENFF
jgi:DNA-directed RNA polymerase specialized sigma24 family protein